MLKEICAERSQRKTNKFSANTGRVSKISMKIYQRWFLLMCSMYHTGRTTEHHHNRP